MGPRTDLGTLEMRKISQPVASHYTNLTISAPHQFHGSIKSLFTYLRRYLEVLGVAPLAEQELIVFHHEDQL